MEGKVTKKIGAYTIGQEVLGRGSFSTVYLAHDSEHHSFAAKVIPLSHLQNSTISLEQEITCLRKCSHENVVKLIDVLKTKNNLYIIMEYCPEGSLEELLARTGPLSEDEALNYFGQIVRGLQVMSTVGVVHRDLKPANILISGKTLRIADFGLAKKYQNGEMLTSYKGTPLNMAPEILTGGNYNNKVDVYSAGTILYEMLFGICPFVANTQHEIADKIKKGLKIKSSSVVSKDVQQLLIQMLDADPFKRIPLEGVLDFLHKYAEKRRQERLNVYRGLSKTVMGGLGVMGAILGAFNWKDEPSSPSTISNMDLKLYGRLCYKLSSRA